MLLTKKDFSLLFISLLEDSLALTPGRTLCRSSTGWWSGPWWAAGSAESACCLGCGWAALGCSTERRWPPAGTWSSARWTWPLASDAPERPPQTAECTAGNQQRQTGIKSRVVSLASSSTSPETKVHLNWIAYDWKTHVFPSMSGILYLFFYKKVFYSKLLLFVLIRGGWGKGYEPGGWTSAVAHSDERLPATDG